ncbi:hypothetical protein BH10BDE1_BH10BDE1_21320 [soil metagenome]
MTKFPLGQLAIREFASMTEAHFAASEISSAATTANFDLRLIEVSPTAGGAWVCAWAAATAKSHFEVVAKKSDFEIVDVDESLMNALLSLGPKPPIESTRILILESKSIADVLRSAKIYEMAGSVLLEIRIKRSGSAAGAYAFLAADDKPIDAAAPLKATSIKIVGDYRRFFF